MSVKAEEFNPHGSERPGDDEQYTPVWITNLARRVMGSIDLDPASDAFGNSRVGARDYFSRESEPGALARPWWGNVWLNMPFGRATNPAFTSKFLQEWDRRRIWRACLITFNSTETTWAQALMARCSAICFPRRRVEYDKFADGVLIERPGAKKGSMIFYFTRGGDAAVFEYVFSEHGIVFRSDGE